MKRYTYKAKDKSGKTVTGEVEASSEHAAAKLVRERGMLVLSIRLNFMSPLSFIKGFKDRITP